MGLYDRLTGQGSTLSITGNGSTPSINPLASKNSKLHADGNAAGYSLDGSNESTVNAQYQQYVDGVPNLIPRPSQLDLDGATPSRYIDNPPR